MIHVDMMLNSTWWVEAVRVALYHQGKVALQFTNVRDKNVITSAITRHFDEYSPIIEQVDAHSWVVTISSQRKTAK